MASDTPRYARLIAPVVREALLDMPVVCVVGPRQSGKTTLVQELAPSRPFTLFQYGNEPEGERVSVAGVGVVNRGLHST